MESLWVIHLLLKVLLLLTTGRAHFSDAHVNLVEMHYYSDSFHTAAQGNCEHVLVVVLQPGVKKLPPVDASVERCSTESDNTQASTAASGMYWHCQKVDYWQGTTTI